MPNYNPGDLGLRGSPSFQGVDPVHKYDKSAARVSMFEELAGRFIEGASRGHAKKQGRIISGVNQTAVETGEEARLFEETVASRMEGKNLTEDEIADLRRESLSEVATTTKTIKRLIAENKISSVEGEARMNQLLSAKLANPFTAMFEGDFREVAATYTGSLGLSADEKEAQRRAKAFEEARAVVLQDQANLMAGGTPPDVAMSMAEGMMATRTENEQLKERIVNGEIKDKVVVGNALSTNTNIFYGDVARTLNQPQFRDPDGRINPAGLQQAELLMGQWRQQQEDLIRRSSMSQADKDAAFADVARTLGGIGDLAQSQSSGNFYKLQKDLSMNYLTAEFYKNYPIGSWFAQNGMPELAKIALSADPSQRGGILKALGFNVERLDQLRAGTFFRGGVDLTGFDYTSTDSVDNKMIVESAAAGQGGEVSSKLPSKKKEAFRKTVLHNSRQAPDLLATPEVAEAVKAGDEFYIQSIKDTLQSVHGDLVATAILDSTDLSGSSVKSRGWREGSRLDQYHPSYIKLSVPEDAEGLEGSVKTIKGVYKTIYRNPSSWEGQYDNPVDAMNSFLRGEFKPFTQASVEEESPSQAPVEAPEGVHEKDIVNPDSPKGRLQSSKIKIEELEATVKEMESRENLNAVGEQVLQDLKEEIARRKGG